MAWEWTCWAVAAAGAALALRSYWPLWRLQFCPRSLGAIRAVQAQRRGATPKVSVIVPACDEEGAIGRCLQSLAAQDYPELEIIAVNDRSTDATGRIMDGAARASGRIRVLHVAELPAGWLGKCHANAVGAAQATGSWLLFTDGDVFFEPDAIRLAMAHAGQEQLDHLTLFPGLVPGGYWETAAVALFGVLLVDVLKITHVRNPLRPDAFAGIGAFNLVRAPAYSAIGGHGRLRMAVADDVKLGKLLKQCGFVSDVLPAGKKVTVRWQIGLRGVVRGLEKNGFAATDFRTGPAMVSIILLVVAAIVPLMGVAVGAGASRVVFALWAAANFSALGLANRTGRFGVWVWPAFPIVSLAMAYAMGRSMLSALWRGGITWRETFYSLHEVRNGVS